MKTITRVVCVTVLAGGLYLMALLNRLLNT